mgnify:CR=1 FL=1
MFKVFSDDVFQKPKGGISDFRIETAPRVPKEQGDSLKCKDEHRFQMFKEEFQISELKRHRESPKNGESLGDEIFVRNFSDGVFQRPNYILPITE